MSNQSVNGFQGSQPFITDKQLQNLSLDEIRHIIEQEKEGLKKNYNELEERKRLIKKYEKLMKLRNQVNQGIDIKKKYKKKKAPTKTKDPFTKLIIKKKKIKTFDDYFEECIKNKEIPKDTPSYLREALERAMREYVQGLVKEKSSLEGFANKYTIEGIPGITPMEFFERINKTLVDFFTYHRNIKFRLILVCIMEKQETDMNRGLIRIEGGKSYFDSGTDTNLESYNVDRLVFLTQETILGKIEIYREKGSVDGLLRR